MGVIAILGNISAALRPVLNKTACHVTGFTDVQPPNVALVIDAGHCVSVAQFCKYEIIKHCNRP